MENNMGAARLIAHAITKAGDGIAREIREIGEVMKEINNKRDENNPPTSGK